MQSLLPLYRSMTSVVLTDGASTSFWHDSWSSAGVLRDSLPVLFSHCLDTSVSVKTAVALGARGLAWPPRLSSAANHELALLEPALATVPLSPGYDLRFITTSPSSSFHTSLVYETIRAAPTAPPSPLADVNWHNFALAKVQFAFWLLRLGRTRTRERLYRHGCLDTDICPFYPGVEDVVHLFVTCPRLRGLWDRFFPDAIASTDVLSIHSSLASTAGLDEPSTNTTLLLTLWCVWKARNRMVFDNITLGVDGIIASMRAHLRLWVFRAPRRVDSSQLLLWCNSLSNVT
ncbi:uncharacterized protein LOC120662836 [Panicum virgatum]|uniref:Reverse transcriptase zinc-binding domain-containing protein n=1 Tax=Panicum virgatum TaxID=38727 RepID=A0A8T0VM01_PANVG|nr:uncharacterized protein LOC120662836 [Panicum virgatum]KAG2637232.1 hypothetical protein PVAP13_2NG507406 [Panicum virgatum]